MKKHQIQCHKSGASGTAVTCYAKLPRIEKPFGFFKVGDLKMEEKYKEKFNFLNFQSAISNYLDGYVYTFL